MEENLSQTLIQLYGKTDADINRLNAALDAMVEKTYGPSQLAEFFKKGLDIGRGGPDRPSRPYSQVEWVYICVNTILNVCQDIQAMLSTADEKILESGPAYDWLFNNPDQPFTEFERDTLGFTLLHREVYWVFAEKDRHAPKKVLVVSRKQIEPQVKDGVLVGYKMKVGARDIPLYLEDVHPLIGFNPDDRHRGVGPEDAGQLDISSSYQATLFNEATMANGARVSTVLTVPPGVTLQDDEKNFLIRQFEARHAGARNAGRTFLATGGMDIKTLSQTMAELQMVDLRRFDATAICALFGVPGEIVGLNSEAQYAHGPAQQRFFMYTIMPLLSFVADHVTRGLLHRFRFRETENRYTDRQHSIVYCGAPQPLRKKRSFKTAKRKALQSGQKLFFWYDVDSHPVIQEMLRERAEKAIKWIDKGVPLNQVIDSEDLPFEKVPWGDHHWTDLSKVPAQWILDAGPESMTAAGPAYEPEDEEPEKTFQFNELAGKMIAEEKAKRDRVWEKHVRSWHPLEREMTKGLRAFFLRQRRELTGKLQAAWQDAKSLDRAKAADDIIARVVLDLRVEDGRLRVLNRVAFTKAAQLGAAQTIAETTGAAGAELAAQAAESMARPEVKGALARSSQNITSVNRTTQKAIAKTLREGLDAGEGLRELTERLKGKLDGNLAKAQRIARTQTSGAVSSGRFAGLKKTGAKLKTWLTARDENVRSAHRAAEQAYAKGIPTDEPFSVAGESLMYPGDPAGSAGNIVNCRCVLLARYGAGKSFDLDFYDGLTFLSAADLKTLFNED